MKEVRICALPKCNKPIPVGRRSDAKYCSKQCNANSHYFRHGDRIRAQYAEEHPPVAEVRQCDWEPCGKDFVRGRSDQVYCSPSCVKKASAARHADEIAAKNAAKKEERRRLRLARMARPRPVKPCTFEGCGITSETDPTGQFRGDMCFRHYQQEYRASKRAAEFPRICLGPFCAVDISRTRINRYFCSPSCRTAAHVLRTDRETYLTRKSLVQGKRRALKYDNPGYEAFTYEQWLDVLVACDFRCTYCNSQPHRLQMDHVFPLAKGGPHCLSNVTPACARCNQSKHDSTLEEWEARKVRRALKKRRSYLFAD